MRVVDYTTRTEFRQIDELLAAGEIEQTVESAAAEIVKDVRRRGDAAVCEYTRRFDEFDLKPELMRVPAHEIEEYAGNADDETTYPAFQRLAAELETRVGFLLAVVADGTPAN